MGYRIVAVVFLMMLLMVCHESGISYAKQHNTDITVNNSFRIGVQLETKCDFTNGRYVYYSRVTVPGKTSRIISVPNNLKICEIWVIKIFLLGGK
jgi:hypothetical protein